MRVSVEVTRRRVARQGGGALLALLMLLVAAWISAAQGIAHGSAAPPVAELVRQLQSPDLRARRDAAAALAAMHPVPPEAIPGLVQALKDRDYGPLQRYAVEGLANAGTPALAALAALLQDHEAEVRQSAVQALGRMVGGEPAARALLIGAFKDDFNRGNAAYGIAKAGAPVVPLLRQTLADDEPRMRAGAALALGLIGPVAVDAVPDLALALQDAAPEVGNQAAFALARIDPHDERAVPVLARALMNEDLRLHVSAAASLEQIGSGARAAVPALERALATDRDALVRQLAAAALGRIGGATACSALARAVTDGGHVTVRGAAARAIAGLWPDCREAMPVLMGTLGDTGIAATQELAGLGEAAVPGLAAALSSPDLYVRQAAVEALAQMKPLSKEAVSALMLALHDRSLEVRSEAARALQDVGGEAERAALAEQDHEAEIYAARSKLDSRPYRKQELIATIPADEDHKYPLELAYLYPVQGARNPGQEPEFLITLFRGRDRPERLVFWRDAGEGTYRQVKVIEPEDPDFASTHFAPPKTFTARVLTIENGRSQPGFGRFVDVPMDGWRTHADQVFALTRDDLPAVEIQSPEDWYKDKLRPGEQVWSPAGNSFSDDRLTFAFSIWSGDDAICCPTAGGVKGTYKIIEETVTTAASSIASGAILGNPTDGHESVGRPPDGPPRQTTTWKMMVDTAERELPSRRP